MRDNILTQMFRMPLTMAQIGMSQLQDIVSVGGENSLHAGSPHPASASGLSSVVDRGRSMMRAATDTLQQTGVHAPATHEPMVPRVRPDQLGDLDVTTFAVLGDGLSAGFTSFSLSAESQGMSFVAQLARHLGAEFREPMIQAPGLGPTGCDQSVHIPDIGQTTVLEPFPPAKSFSNSSVPGFTTTDARRLRPQSPLVQQGDAKQTAANLIIDPLSIIEGRDHEAPTQLEAVLSQAPTFVIVSLGFADILQPIVNRLEKLPDAASFAREYTQILSSFAETTTALLVTTIPNPLDTAGLSSLQSAAKVLKTSVDALHVLYGLDDDDHLTIDGLVEIGCQIVRRQIRSLDEAHVVRGKEAKRIRQVVDSLNVEIREIAVKHGAVVADLNSLFRSTADRGFTSGTVHLSADFLGGFYSLNGFTPGATGQAIVANAVISAMNSGFNAAIPLLDPKVLIAQDSVAQYRMASGREWTLGELQAFTSTSEQADADHISRPVAGRSPHRNTNSRVCRFRSMEERYNAVYRDPPPKPLELPSGLEQELTLLPQFSYYGDAISAVDCSANAPFRERGCPARLFSGYAMFAGELQGVVRIRFSPPVNNVTRFEVTFGEGLAGADGQIAAPEFIRLPVMGGRVSNYPGRVCAGDLNLVTGETTNLDFNFQFVNSALLQLVSVNPSFPQVPIQFPGQYGTVVVRFLQRHDGKLDFVFSGTTFAPLGVDARFPLPFQSGSNEVASIPASGTALHPHLHLSTLDLSVGDDVCVDLQFPANTVQELTTTVSRTDFGDEFLLNHPDLGFARGRSQLTGRVMVQFGDRVGDSQQFAVSVVPPGGSLFEQNIEPLQSIFPGQLNQGLLGHNSALKFPSREYATNDMFLLDDPFDIAWGTINVRTGEVNGDFLHRALFGQNVFYALIRIEPRTPQGSFQYRGPALFERERNGQLRYRFNGTTFLPYQEGFLFPQPNLAQGFIVGDKSRLDPFFQIDAASKNDHRSASKSGSARMQLSTNGDRFSYSYSISTDSKRQSTFEYTNHSQNAMFSLHGLTWVNFTDASSGNSRSYHTVTFSGFGTWNSGGKVERKAVSVQISTSPGDEYVTILVGGGQVSNVNTKPRNPMAPLTAIPAGGRD